MPGGIAQLILLLGAFTVMVVITLASQPWIPRAHSCIGTFCGRCRAVMVRRKHLLHIFLASRRFSSVPTLSKTASSGN
jgi:hypothetical protein